MWLRPLAELSASPIDGTEGVDQMGSLFWSPDSRYLGFFADEKLKKVGIGGDPVVELAEATSGRGGSWNEQGVILFSPYNAGEASRLFRVSDRGGDLQRVTTGGEQSHRSPHFLPGGESFLFYFRRGAAGAGTAELRLGDLQTQESQTLIDAESHGVFFPSRRGSDGYLLSVHGDVLVAYPFAPGLGRITGAAFAVAQDVGIDVAMGRGLFSVSTTGVLAYSAERYLIPERRIVMVDRQGSEIASVGPEGSFLGLRIAPDQTRVAVQTRVSPGYGLELFTIDLADGRILQPAPGFRGVGLIWTPDSAALVASIAEQTYLIPADGSSQRESIAVHPRAALAYLSPKGDWLLLESFDRDGLLVMPQDGSAEPEFLLETEFKIEKPRFSPDGDYVAYTSDESGVNEVYVQRFPSGPRVKASFDRGSTPVWSQDGSELFYVSSNDDLMATPIVRSGDRIRFGRPERLFRLDEQLRNLEAYRYDVFADGKRFFVFRGTVRSEPGPITVVVNWDIELERAVAERKAEP